MPMIRALATTTTDADWFCGPDKLYYLKTRKDSFIWALGELGDPRAIPALITLLVNSSPVDPKVAEALTKMGSPAIEPLIRSMTKATKNRRIHIGKILGDITGERYCGKNQTKWYQWLAEQKALTNRPGNTH